MSSFSDLVKEVARNKDAIIIPKLDTYLIGGVSGENDRAVGVNAPSSAGDCNRANYYSRTGVEADELLKPRTVRIFDNGTKVHERLQGYMLDMGLLVMDEVPLINDEYNIQGHTDGYLDLGDEIAILEIKSINDAQFNQLKDAKEEHKCQGLIYLFCAEERRKYLRDTYKTKEDFYESEPERKAFFEKHYQHLQDGAKYTRAEKMKFSVDNNLISDDILYFTEKPVNKIVFLYEDKNNQELKEFVLVRNKENEPILQDTLSRYTELERCLKSGEIPKREGTNKSCNTCRWCDYKNTCWVV